MLFIDLTKRAQRNQYFVNKKISDLAERISEDTSSWMRQYEKIARIEIQKRIKYEKTTKNIIRNILGLFIKPRLGVSENIYIFEGLRNIEYIKILRPEEVIIIGTKLEREYASTNGYRFCWSFPIESAVHFKRSKGWNYFINHQIKLWLKELAKYKKVIFFLYEDTQPLGIFLVHISRILKSTVTSVCIQHGYFFKQNFRCEGVLADVNLLWDIKQVELIGCNKFRSYQIGLPYQAKAKKNPNLLVILVGTGTNNEDLEKYERDLDALSKIKSKINQSNGLTILYRPHPNEWKNQSIIKIIRNKFNTLDELDKVQRLNGPNAIFIGTLSSLLYEAGVAGHIVAHLNQDSENEPTFKKHITFDIININDLLSFINNIDLNQYYYRLYNDCNKSNHIERFVSALKLENLIKNEDLVKNKIN